MTDHLNRHRIYPDGDKTLTPNVNRIANQCCICGIEIREGNHTCTACRRFYLTAPERYRVLTMPPKKVCGLLEEDDYMMKAGIYKTIPWASNIALSEEESGMYIQRALDQEGEALKAVKLCFDEEGNVDIDKSVRGMHFERIRRITGYLVGTLDRFNDGKRAEEQDRVTHDVGYS